MRGPPVGPQFAHIGRIATVLQLHVVQAERQVSMTVQTVEASQTVGVVVIDEHIFFNGTQGPSVPVPPHVFDREPMFR